MHWVDVCGAPGVGKSTLCDPLWAPHDIPITDVSPPAEWHDFTNEVTRLLGVIRDHPTFTAAVRMNRRSMRKMATVSQGHFSNERTMFDAASGSGIETLPYIQTGFVQRGLGFGWRLVDMGKPVEELFHFFRLMPVSIGVVFLEADADTIKSRNKDRESVAATAHENRSHMVDLMQPAIEYAKEVLIARDVPILELNTGHNAIDGCRERLLDFAAREPRHSTTLRYSSQAPVLQTHPVWW